jgi:predicted PurR-regulated permease PerM
VVPTPIPETRLQVQWLIEKRWTRWLWFLAALVLVGYIAWVARDIWLPITLAFLIAMVLDPVVDKLEARGWSRAWGATLIFGCFIIALGVALFFAVPALIHQGQTLGDQFNQYLPNRSPQGITKTLEAHQVNSTVADWAGRASAQVQVAVQQSGSWIKTNAMKIASNAIWIVIIPIVAFYALKDFHLILAKTLLLVPKKRREIVQSLVAEVTVIFAKYMRGLMTVAVLNGLATWLVLTVLRVPNAFMLGCVAGLLYSVPYIGALTTIVLVAAVSFLSGGLNFMLLVVGVNVVLHQIIFDQIISPRILGGHVGLHPILSILALLIGNELLGVAGMILAVPVAASVQVAVLTLVPKLNQEIDLSSATVTTSQAAKEPEQTAQAAADSDNPQEKLDVSMELHKGVEDAVAQAEANMEEEQAQSQAKAAEETEVGEENLAATTDPPTQVIQIQPIVGTHQANPASIET